MINTFSLWCIKLNILFLFMFYTVPTLLESSHMKGIRCTWNKLLLLTGMICRDESEVCDTVSIK